jgi:hypothetical protein
VNRILAQTAVDAAGNLTGALPDPFPRQSGYDQRLIQVGLKVNF